MKRMEREEVNIPQETKEKQEWCDGNKVTDFSVVTMISKILVVYIVLLTLKINTISDH